MTSITKHQQGSHMTQPTLSASPGAITNLAAPAAHIDIPLNMTRLIVSLNALFPLALLWGMFVPESSLGVLRLLTEDTGAPRGVVSAVLIAFFMADTVQWSRGIKMRWLGLYGLSGQFVLAVISVIYFARGSISLITLVGHGGLFVMSALCLGIAVQMKEYRHAQRELETQEERYRDALATLNPNRAVSAVGMAPRIKYPIRPYLAPTISVILFLCAIGLIIRPDSAIAMFIQNTYSLAYFVVVVAWLVIGSGALRINHVSAGGLFLSVLGYILFVFLLIGLSFSVANQVSLLTLLTHVSLASVFVFAAYLQTEPIEGV